MLSLDKRIKSGTRQVDAAYVVGYTFGKSARGRQYAYALLSENDEPSDMSFYSIRLTNKLKKHCQISIPDLTDEEPGFRKAIELEKAVLLDEPIFFCRCIVSPWGLKNDQGKVNWRNTVYACEANEGDIAASILNAMQYNYAKADVFAKGGEYLKDYKDAVIFELDRSDLERIFNPEDEEEDEE